MSNRQIYKTNYLSDLRVGKQRGAALVLALIMLAVLTIFAITSINVSNTEDAMMHNTIAYKVALTSAEASLRDGIDNVVDNPASQQACANLSDTSIACGGDEYYQLDGASRNIRISAETSSFWKNRAADIQSVSDAQLNLISGSSNNIPQRIVTKRPIPNGGSLDIGFNGGVRKVIYEVTAIGRDKNNKTQVVLRQSLVRNEAK